MAAPIGPGDFVECICAAGVTSNRLSVGAIYKVAAVGMTPPDDAHPNVAWVALFNPPPAPGKQGFEARRFRPVYKPNADLIENLKAPPIRIREDA